MHPIQSHDLFALRHRPALPFLPPELRIRASAARPGQFRHGDRSAGMGPLRAICRLLALTQDAQRRQNAASASTFFLGDVIVATLVLIVILSSVPLLGASQSSFATILSDGFAGLPDLPAIFTNLVKLL